MQRVEQLRILVRAETFFNERVPASQRKDWLRRAAVTLRSIDVAFLDPDNGISHRDKNSRKHATWYDVSSFEVATIVVYHHLGRQKKHDAQMSELINESRNRFPERAVLAAHFRLGGSRCFLISSDKSAAPSVDRALRALVNDWKPAFRLLNA